MTGGMDVFKMLGLAKTVMPILKYFTSAPKPTLEEEPIQSELEIEGKKIYTLQYTYIFDTKETREEFLKADDDFQGLLANFGKFAKDK